VFGIGALVDHFTATTSATIPLPAGAAGVTKLVFTGAVGATADADADVRVPATTEAQVSAAADSGQDPDWVTQCDFSDGSWSSTLVVNTPGNQWSINIADTADSTGASSTAAVSATPGYPRPGTYLGAEGRMKSYPPRSLSLQILSRHGIASYLNPDTSDGQRQDSLFGYYTPMEHNGGYGSVSLAPGLRSGSLDVWLTPDDPSGGNLVFHMSGDWTCE
jgi:hypothetical protein